MQGPQLLSPNRKSGSRFSPGLPQEIMPPTVSRAMQIATRLARIFLAHFALLYAESHPPHPPPIITGQHSTPHVHTGVIPFAASAHGFPVATHSPHAAAAGNSALPAHRVHVPADNAQPPFSTHQAAPAVAPHGHAVGVTHGHVGQISLPDGFSPESVDGRDGQLQYHILLDAGTMAPRAMSISTPLMEFMRLQPSVLELQLQQRQMSSLLHPQYFTQRLKETLTCHLSGEISFKLKSVILQCCGSADGAAAVTPPHSGGRTYRAFDVVEHVTLHKNSAGQTVGSSHTLSRLSDRGNVVQFHSRGGSVLPVASELLSRIPLPQAQTAEFVPLKLTELPPRCRDNAAIHELHSVADVHDMVKVHRSRSGVAQGSGCTHVVFESAATADCFLPLFRVVNILTAFSGQALENAVVVQSLLRALPDEPNTANGTEAISPAQQAAAATLGGMAAPVAASLHDSHGAGASVGGGKRSRVSSHDTCSSSEGSKRARNSTDGTGLHTASDVHQMLFRPQLGASLGFNATAPVTISTSTALSSSTALNAQDSLAHTVACQALHPASEAQNVPTSVPLSELPRISMGGDFHGTGLPDGAGLGEGNAPSLVSTGVPNMSFGGMPAVDFANSLNGAMSALIRVASEGVEEGGAWDMPLLRLGSAQSTHAPEGKFSLDSPKLEATSVAL